MMRLIMRGIVWLAACAALAAPAAAASLSFTLNASEPVAVTGTPRIAIDVGGTPRYASYASGSGTAALTFSYAIQPGDFDADGITVSSPLDLNGGTFIDLAGNPPSALNFSVPDTSAIKVQTYTAAFTTSPVTSANASAVSFVIAKAPSGASFTYTITSTGGAGSVTGSGTISGPTHTVSGVNLSTLPAGTFTLSVTVTGTSGAGAARTGTAMPSLSGAFDALPNAALALSVRRLRGAYMGPLMRVRRSSDNATRDIGATFAGDLDTANLLSFCGASSCFVTTWYDQSGNGNDAVQATAANQSRIVNAGSVEMEGTWPALRYPGTGRLLAAPSIPQTVNGTINAVARCGNTSQMHIMGDRSGPSNSYGRFIRAASGGASFFAANLTGAQVSVVGSTQQQRVVTVVSGTAGLTAALDGVETVGGTSTVYQPATNSWWIGGMGPGVSIGDWVGTISEAMLFNLTMTTSERQALDRNQGAYYGIAVQ